MTAALCSTGICAVADLMDHSASSLNMKVSIVVNERICHYRQSVHLTEIPTVRRPHTWSLRSSQNTHRKGEVLSGRRKLVQ